MGSKAPVELGRRLAYAFHDPALLEHALTHRSKSRDNYERLEFLGDSVLSFVISAELFRLFPQLAEGELTRLRARLVRKPTLAELARKLELGDFLALGEGELKSGGYDRDSILADSLEAVFGALCLDGGIDTARRIILQLYRDTLATLDPHAVPKDPKTELQEYLQKLALPTPVYQVIEMNGAAHHQHFVVECRVATLDQPVRGEGNSRRNAEQQAAAQALALLAQQ